MSAALRACRAAAAYHAAAALVDCGDNAVCNHGRWQWDAGAPHAGADTDPCAFAPQCRAAAACHAAAALMDCEYHAVTD